MILIAIFGLVAIGYLKIMNIVHKGEDKSIIREILELALGFLFLLFLFFAQFTAIHASSEQPFYEGDVFEASQYLTFGVFMLLALTGLTLLEILFTMKLLVTRGRLLPDAES